ncbi:MAG: tetratricopeptide repeat protein, partial [Desulfobacteraceae bacterium]|nr:tetratricopeptide repeat protein [Desulfobacteraceae bacterium]
IQSIPFDDRQFCYRYNRLFRDFLHRRFEEAVPEPERRRLLVKVAEAYRSAGRIEDGIKYFLRAGDYDTVADGIRSIGIDRVIRGRTVELNQWIEALPENFVREDPWISFFWTLARRLRGGVRSVAEFEALVDRFNGSGDARGELLSLAYLIETMVFTGAGPEALLARIQQACALLERLRSLPYYTYAKTLLWLHIGLGSIVYGYNLQKGLSACRNAFLLSRQMNDDELEVNALVVSVLGRALSGDFIEAERIVEKIGNRIDAKAFPEYRALFGIVHTVSSLYQGRLDRARETANRVREDIETYGLLFLYPAFIDASGLLEVHEGRFSAAESTSRHLSDVAMMADSTFYQGLSKRLAGLAYYQCGRLAQAETILGEALEDFGCEGGANLHVAQLQTLMGLLRQRSGDHEKARDYLHEAMRTVKGAGSPIFEAEVHMATALNAHLCGDGPTELFHLTQGFNLVRDGSYRHRIVLGKDDFRQILQLARNHGVAGTDRLLSRQTKDEEVGETDAATGAGVVLSARFHRSPDRLTVNALGGLEVRRGNGTPIADREWAGRRSKTLLMAIVARGAREVPVDVLIEDLWPESHPRRAMQNFKVTLHRLRKVLEPDLAPRQRSAFVHLKDQRVSLDAVLCRIDVELFLETTKSLRRLGDHGNPDEVLLLCAGADALYRGDFLPEELYSHWAELKRSALKEQYRMALMRMGDVYSGRGDLQQAAEAYQKVLRVDPFHEAAQRGLMRSLARMGSRSAALRVYRDFSATLSEEIGESPDPRTTRLYEAILDGSTADL